MLLPRLKNIISPKSLSEAVRILERGKGKYVPLAGGTSLTLSQSTNVEGLVDLSGLQLDYIRETKRLVKIGAMTRMQDIYESSILRETAGGMLCEAAHAIGSTPNRNLITMGGNLVALYMWSIMPVALLALDAQITIAGRKKRKVHATDFFAKHPKKFLARNEIVTEVTIAKSANKLSAGCFIKFAKTATDYPMISLTTYLALDKNAKIAEARIAVGSIARLPLRLESVEKLLNGQTANKRLFVEAGAKASSSIKPLKDMRASTDYKKEISGVLVRRALLTCLERITSKK
jgi:CO/xanthine dehydrogenase FAD-binding subunit